METAGLMGDGDHLATHRDALYVGVEQGQEDGDPRDGLAAKPQFGRRRHRLQQAHLTVGGGDDQAGPGRGRPPRVPEEAGVRARRCQAQCAQPAMVAAGGRYRKATCDERQAGGMHGWD